MGKAKNLKQRVSSYFTNKSLGTKTKQLVLKTKRIKTIETYSEVNSLILEANLVKKYKPEYNIKLTDDKSYQYVKITIKDAYPKVLTARRINDNSSFFFGPYPNSRALKVVLKTLRKIFPFQSTINHPKKICLYNHLGLCPCPEILKVKDYKEKNIKYIIRFLKGENKKILAELIKERNLLSKNEKFEKAKNIQRQINAISLITNPDNRIFDYETDANLSYDLVLKKVNDLKNVLNSNGYSIKSLKKIECFDASNISGSNMVASMVVFINGVEQKFMYRKFRIRTLKADTQDDYMAIGEALSRRLSHAKWKYPDLIVIDGGKGQVSKASSIIKERQLNIPIIGLAKKEELIITSTFKEIKLGPHSPALMLLKRIRDEAHRFAISYHKSLRAKSFLN